MHREVVRRQPPKEGLKFAATTGRVQRRKGKRWSKGRQEGGHKNKRNTKRRVPKRTREKLRIQRKVICL
ncbi:hypothetical protein BS47DRAFT_1340996, partial [Hydnum rufescens UP504]